MIVLKPEASDRSGRVVDPPSFWPSRSCPAASVVIDWAGAEVGEAVDVAPPSLLASA